MDNTEVLWRPKVGEPFPIRLMSDTHLNNAILMLRRFGYITTHEAGPKPDTLAEMIVWASKPASRLLELLSVERLKRINDNAEPYTDEQATEDQAEWFRVQRNAVARRHPQPYYGRSIKTRPFSDDAISERQWRRERRFLPVDGY